jgi:amino acid adenylation domain-containing protein
MGLFIVVWFRGETILPMTPTTLTSEFERQVALHGDRVAVDTGERRIRYGELDRLANGVASALIAELGDRPQPVPLLMEQNIPFAAGLLGAMKAGKSFAPLDPVLPPFRLTHIVQDLGAGVLLTDSAHLAPAAALVDALDAPRPRVLSVEALERQASDRRPVPPPAPDELAWILFTSGSTGRPKGIPQNHRNAVFMTRRYIEIAAIRAEDRLSLLHPALTWDIFGALLSGAALCPYDLRSQGVAGAGKWLRDSEITLYRSFPTAFRQIVAGLEGVEIPAVRLVHLSGETVVRGDVERFRRHFRRGVRLLVLFGSTEAGIVSTEVIDHDTEVGEIVPIGRPVEDVEIQLRNEVGRPARPREVGEICVRSAHVFPGYWRKPNLSQAAFLPREEGAGGAFFRTGDLAWAGDGGKLFYAGRRDAQIKVRGYRIELEEIEQALQSHSRVRQGAARAFDSADGDKRLVGYYVPEGAELPQQHLLDHLRQRLPVYMLPDRLLRLDALPTTSNGKIDRLALPPPPRTRPALDVEFVAAAGPLEKMIAALFAEILELDAVGAHDSFFALGGESLGAFRVLARIAKSCGVSLTFREFFETPTAAETALRLVLLQELEEESRA